MKILSTDKMASIPKAYIKKFVKKSFGANITDDGAAEMIKILEKRAKEISSYAVVNAKKRNREGKVTKEDIMEYTLKGKASDNGH